MAESFRLTAVERALHGVSLRSEDVLVLRASGSEVVRATLLLVLGSVIGIGIVVSTLTSNLRLADQPIRNETAGVMAGVAITFGFWLYALGVMRTSVVADKDGISLSSWVGRERHAWTSISNVAAVEMSTGRPLKVFGLTEINLSVPPVGKWSVGVIVLESGAAVQLPGCVSAGHQEGLQLSGPTPTETKIEALRRFWVAHGGQPVSAAVPVTSRELGAGLRTALALLAPFAIWGIASWALDELISPIWLLLGLAGSIYAELKASHRMSEQNTLPAPADSD